MEKKQIIQYQALKNHSGILAKACNVSPSYVLRVLNGQRTPKTARATKAALIFQKADALLELLKPTN